jgi:hypothetical protein
MDAQPSTENQSSQPQNAAAANVADPRLVEMSNHVRVIRNVANIIDRMEIKGVQTATALVEAAKFVENLHDQVKAQLDALQKELSNVETPTANQEANVPASMPVSSASDAAATA